MSLEHEPLHEPEVVEVLRLRTEQEFGTVPEAELAVAPPKKLSAIWLWAAGVAALALAGAFLVATRPSSVAPVSSLISAPTVRTVPVGSVTYGPDIAAGFDVDPSFVPSGKLPTGISISAMAGKLIWGCGNGKVGGAQPPEGASAKLIEERMVELLEYVRHQHVETIPLSPAMLRDPKLNTKLPSMPVTLSLEWRNGGGGTTVTVPTVDGPKADAELRRIAHNAAKLMTDQTADSIQWMRANDPNLP